MTVQELINKLSLIEDKSLPVVADIGFDFCDRPEAETIEDLFETKEYFMIGAEAKTRKCIKLVG